MGLAVAANGAANGTGCITHLPARSQSGVDRAGRPGLGGCSALPGIPEWWVLRSAQTLPLHLSPHPYWVKAVVPVSQWGPEDPQDCPPPSALLPSPSFLLLFSCLHIQVPVSCKASLLRKCHAAKEATAPGPAGPPGTGSAEGPQPDSPRLPLGPWPSRGVLEPCGFLEFSAGRRGLEAERENKHQ